MYRFRGGFAYGFESHIFSTNHRYRFEISKTDSRYLKSVNQTRPNWTDITQKPVWIEDFDCAMHLDFG